MPALGLDALLRSLKKNALQPVYLLHGDEDVLKDEAIRTLLETAVGEPPRLDQVPGDWRARLELWARSEWAMFQRYPWALQLVSTRTLMGPNRLGWLEVALRTLSGIGLTGREMFDAVNLVDRYVRGTAQTLVAAADQGAAITHQRWWSSHAALVDRISKDGRFPALTSVWSAGMSGVPKDELDFGLQRVLDGLAAHVGVRAATRAEHE